MKKEITGVLIDPELCIAERRTIEASAKSYSSLLRFSDVETVSCKIGGRRFDILCNSDAISRRTGRPSARGRLRRPKLYGPLFVVKAVWETGPESLNDDDADYILGHTRTIQAPFRKPSITLCGVSLQ